MRVLFCGGRDFNDKNFIFKTLDNLFPDAMSKQNVCVIAGGARGADTLAVDWAVINYLPFEEFKADWNTYGKSAGAIRNQKMLVEGKPDLVLAFPGGTGTADMVRRSEKAGVPVNKISAISPTAEAEDLKSSQ